MRHTPLWMSGSILAATALVLAVFYGLPDKPQAPPELIRVEGGSFLAGNFQVAWRAPDGQISTAWTGTQALDTLPPYPVTVSAFAIMKTEASNRLYDRFLAQTQRAPRWQPQKNDALHPADMPYHEAQAFCIWLGQQQGLAMRLPTEAEWEYAARSRGLATPWATDNGQWQPGRNLPEQGVASPGQLRHEIAAFPPNSLGIQDMASGLYEWVIADPERDPANERIFKGGSDTSHSPFETIPTRGSTPALSEELIQTLPHLERLRKQAQGTVYMANATARCVATAKTGDGIGTPPRPMPALPAAFDQASVQSAATP
ncbi:MAG TPA: SUMF1/EgtB/PvdO family nonheme iron enzyme [Alcaligenes sp.]|nr:SUMF1/EgtB/PvdO family nonheme iron enzyme [Alcaligenes sp.]HRL27042.1 SUMF1/EgtB/PvdO family nonheme iron enzyme [Alcaligenes sp.]